MAVGNRGGRRALTRRAALIGAGAVVGIAASRWTGAQNPTLQGVAVIAPQGGAGVLNDASLLSETPIFKHIVIKEAPGDALIAALRAELAAATADGRCVNIGAARHSMGGQAIPRDGHAISYDYPFVSHDTGAETYTVQAGTRWHQVIGALDPLGLSPKVMQSNADFGVAATFSVNAHGWPCPFGPMGSTVRSVGMVLADGTFLRASATENADLFAAAMGGYGLIGLITDLELEAAPNLLLEPTFRQMPAAEFAAAFTGVMDGSVPMAYGRLNIDREGFFDDAMLVTYHPVPGEVPPASGSGLLSKISRHIFREQVGNEWVKRRRWGIETGIGASLQGAASRSSLMNEPVITLDDRDPTRTDILHEYFVAPERFGDFLDAARQIIPASYQELLNITLRYVARDATSLLAYAPGGPRIASVLLFSQEMTARAEADMARMTGAMIEAVLAIGGSYYLVELTNRIASAANIEYHARIVAQKYIQRELIKISTNTIHDAYEDSTDVFQLLDDAEKGLFNIMQQNLNRSAVDMGTLTARLMKQLDELSKKEAGLTGIESGFTALDRVTSGWQPSDLIIMAARPGMGKTSLVLAIARNAAMDYGRGVALFSLEMSSVQLVQRLVSMEAEIAGSKLRTAKMEPYEWQQLQSAIEKMSAAPLYIDDTPSINIFELRAKCRRLKMQHNIDLIIIDYLQLMTGTSENNRGGGNREQEIANISRSLKGLAKELNVPVIALSQLSRAVETRGGAKRPMLSDLRESGAIEQDADIVSFIYRPEYYQILEDEEGQSLKGIAEIIIAKHRNGALETIKLKFIDHFAKFANLDDMDFAGFLPSGAEDGAFSSNANSNIITRPSRMNDEDIPF